MSSFKRAHSILIHLLLFGDIAAIDVLHKPNVHFRSGATPVISLIASRSTLILAVCLAVLLSIAFSACDETLSDRNDPRNQLTSSLSWHYSYTQKENAYSILLIVRNNSDETMQGVAVIDGTIQIDWLLPPELTGDFLKQRTDRLDVRNIKGARQFEPSTGKLTLAPGDSITIFYNWDLRLDDSTSLLDIPAFKVGRKQDDYKYSRSYCFDNQSSPRWFYARQTYHIQASVQLFNQTGVIYPPEMTFSSCYIFPFAGSSRADDPCELISFPDRSCEIYAATP